MKRGLKVGLQGGLQALLKGASGGLHLCEAFKGLKGASRGLEKGFKGASRGLQGGLQGGLRRASRGLEKGLKVKASKGA